MKRYIGIVLAGILAISAVGCGSKTETTENTENTQSTTNDTTAQQESETTQDIILQAQMPEDGEEIAIIQTSEGEIQMRFFPDEAPKAVENFKTLAKEGYYDGLTFHRVIEDFMIQTGDPTGTGAGGESCWGTEFEDEISPNLHFYNGAVAMANKGPNTNGSQFFIVQSKTAVEDHLQMLQDARDNEINDEPLGITIGDTFYTIGELFPDSVLDYYREHGGATHLEYIFGNPYTIFGQAISGMDVVDKIAATEVDANDKPVNDIIIESITFAPYSAE